MENKFIKIYTIILVTFSLLMLLISNSTFFNSNNTSTLVNPGMNLTMILFLFNTSIMPILSIIVLIYTAIKKASKIFLILPITHIISGLSTILVIIMSINIWLNFIELSLYIFIVVFGIYLLKNDFNINIKFTKKKITIIIIIIIIATGMFFPKDISTCKADKVCFGYVKKTIQESTWLNIKDSIFEVRENEVKSCIGLEKQYRSWYDGCPGDWGWVWEVPENCNDTLKNCNELSQIQYSHYEIKCSEWQRVCEEIKSANKVHIMINYSDEFKTHLNRLQNN